jgi:hypothetical protein
MKKKRLTSMVAEKKIRLDEALRAGSSEFQDPHKRSSVSI